MLASCSYDHKVSLDELYHAMMGCDASLDDEFHHSILQVIIWKEGQQGWQEVHKTEDSHTSSVNSIAWAPHDFGLALVSGSR